MIRIPQKWQLVAALVVCLLAIAPGALAQGGNIGSNSSPAANSLGRPLPGINVAICQPLATSAASVTSNLAVLTMVFNPIVEGFVAGMKIQVAGFTGGDAFYNGGTFSNGQITGGYTILSVSPTTITYALIHSNQSAGTNGTVLQEGNTATGCAGLSAIYSDTTLSVPIVQPLVTDALGNWNAFAAPGVYYAQFYGGNAVTVVKQTAIACVPSATTGTCGAQLGATNAFANAGVFTNTQMNLTLTSSIDSLNFGTEYVFTQGAQSTTDAFAGGVAAPVGSTVHQVDGVSGYCTNLSTSTNCVGVYGQGRGLAANAHAWGANFVASDGNFSNSEIIGNEIDLQNLNAGSVGAGLTFGGTLASSTGFAAIQIPQLTGGFNWGTGISLGAGSIGAGNGIRFQQGASTGTGTTTNAIYLQPVAAGTSQVSQGIRFDANDAVSGTNTVGLAENAAGDLVATNTKAATGIQATIMKAGQFIANAGAACTNGELGLSAGWQSTGSATVTAVAGTGQVCSWTITTGTTTAANPTITDTLTNAFPAAATVCWMNIYGGTHVAVAGESLRQTTLSATAPVFTANFTPTNSGATYFVTRGCGP